MRTHLRTALAVACAANVSLLAQTNVKDAYRFSTTSSGPAGTPTYNILNINNIHTWHRNDGHSNHSPSAGNGVIYPTGTASLIYQDCIVWGGKVYTNAERTSGPATNPPGHASQPVRIGGGTYPMGTRAGSVSGSGAGAVAEDPAAPDVRMYRIRRDYFSMSDDEVRQDAFETFERPSLGDVTTTDITTIRDRYHADWTNWPVSKGAPYIERNGTPGYQPPPAFGPAFTADDLITGGHDEPGIAGTNAAFPAHQVLWTAYNDLNVTTATGFVGSRPIGVVVQKTVWGYKNSFPLNDVYFVGYKIVNVGGVDTSDVAGDQLGSFWVDSMYVCQWSDPDVGSASDDLSGSDSTLNLGFAYNASPVDAQFSQFNLPPPAIGYKILSGPLVAAPEDSAIFDLKRKQGYRNLGMSSFAYFAAGSQYTDPAFGSGAYDNGASRWWRLLRGFAPLGFWTSGDVDYPSGPYPVSKYPLSGDPVYGTGWLDGAAQSWSFAPGDRRTLVNSGPFQFAPGDTQQFVIGVVAGVAADRASSIALMKATSRYVQFTYDGLFSTTAPIVAADVTYPDSITANIQLNTFGGSPQPVTLTMTGYTADGTVVFSTSLEDDGAHADSLAGDGRFGGAVDVPRQKSPIRRLLVEWVDANAEEHQIEIIEGAITIAGDVEPHVVVRSDSKNGDGEANPGENIRFTIDVANNTNFDLDSISVVVHMQTVVIGDVVKGQVGSSAYDAAQPSTYYVLDIPADASGEIAVDVGIRDNAGNVWIKQAVLEVVPYGAQQSPVGYTTATHTQGRAQGAFEIEVVDPSQLTQHQYRIVGHTSVSQGGPGISLIDLTTGDTLFHKLPQPDEFGHNIPMTHGLRIRRGTITANAGLIPNAWTWVGDNRLLTWLGSTALALEEFMGTFGWTSPAYMFGAIPRVVKPHELKDIEIRFSPTMDEAGNFSVADSNVSYGYRYGRGFQNEPADSAYLPFMLNRTTGYPFQDFTQSVPLAVFDTFSDPPRRLAVGYLENNVAPTTAVPKEERVNGRYWPPPANQSNASLIREWLFIFDEDYSTTPNAVNMVDIFLDSTVRIMYTAVWNRRVDSAWTGGQKMTFSVYRPVTDNDRWEFTPSMLIPLAAPVPDSIAPTVSYAEVEIHWSDVLHATTYELQISTDSIFTDVVFSDTSFTQTTTVDSVGALGQKYIRPMGLEVGVKYFARIRALNSLNTGAWSIVLVFTTFDPALAVELDSDIPTVYSLEQNYPNPFNPSTTIRFGLPFASDVRLRIYNVLGQEVGRLVETHVKEGFHEVTWEATVASGVYFARIEATHAAGKSAPFIATRKMVLLR